MHRCVPRLPQNGSAMMGSTSEEKSWQENTMRSEVDSWQNEEQP